MGCPFLKAFLPAVFALSLISVQARADEADDDEANTESWYSYTVQMYNLAYDYAAVIDWPDSNAAAQEAWNAYSQTQSWAGATCWWASNDPTQHHIDLCNYADYLADNAGWYAHAAQDYADSVRP